MSRKNMEPIIALVAFVIILFWGVQGFFLKLGLAQLSVYETILIGSVTSIALNLVLLAFLLSRKTEFRADVGGAYVALALILGSIAFILWYYLIQNMDIGISTALTSVYPAVTVVLGVLVLQEKLSLASGVGVILAITAAILLAL